MRKKNAVKRTRKTNVKFSIKLAEELCLKISTTSKGLKKICEEPGMPTLRTVFNWLKTDKEGFLKMYHEAKQRQGYLYDEEIIEIADNSANDDKPFVGINYIHRDRLRIEARKWLASKLHPKRYGNKVEIAADEEVKRTVIKWGDREISI